MEGQKQHQWNETETEDTQAIEWHKQTLSSSKHKNNEKEIIKNKKK